MFCFFYINLCFAVPFFIFFILHPNFSSARSTSLPVSLCGSSFSPLLTENHTCEWRNTHHKFCPAVERKTHRAVEGEHRPGYRWNTSSFQPCICISHHLHFHLLTSKSFMNVWMSSRTWICAVSDAVCVFFVDPLVINLKPYTSYTVRLSALNAVGRGKFSETHNVHTQGRRKFFTHYQHII